MFTRQQFWRFALVWFGFALLTGCTTQTDFSLQQMIVNLSRTYPDLWRLITATAYIIGFVFIFQALYHMKIYGELRTMMASQTSFKTPLTYFVAGSSLIYIPTAYNILEKTFFNTTGATILGYAGQQAVGYSEAMSAVLGFVQIVGLIAFVRGWVIVAKGSRQGAQMSIGKGMMHIIGGLLAINIIGTRDILVNTLLR